MVQLSSRDRFLLNNLQEGFPVFRGPFRNLERRWNIPVDNLLSRLNALSRQGIINRFGPVLNPRSFGLHDSFMGMSIPDERMVETIQTVKESPRVFLILQLDSPLNLWVRLTSNSIEQRENDRRRLEESTGFPIRGFSGLSDGAFGLSVHFSESQSVRSVNRTGRPNERVGNESAETTSFQRDLLHATQDGLPLVVRPYRAVASRLGLDEAAVIWGLKDMVRKGKVSRMGCELNPYGLGFSGNGLAVFNLPEDAVGPAANRLISQPEIARCYRSTRRGTDWPYNLIGSLHAPTRAQAEAMIEQFRETLPQNDVSHELLFVNEVFKFKSIQLV